MKKYIIRNVPQARTGFTSIEYRAYSLWGKEIGIIRINVTLGALCEITFFNVKEKWRHQSVGKALMEATVKEARKLGVTEITVHPLSDVAEIETPLTPPELYDIYEHLGFELDDENSNKNEYRHKMIRII